LFVAPVYGNNYIFPVNRYDIDAVLILRAIAFTFLQAIAFDLDITLHLSCEPILMPIILAIAFTFLRAIAFNLDITLHLSCEPILMQIIPAIASSPKRLQ